MRYEYYSFRQFQTRINDSLNKYAKEGWRVINSQVTLEQNVEGYPMPTWNILMERQIEE